MSPQKKDRIIRDQNPTNFSNGGDGGGRLGASEFAAAISAALHRDFADNRSAIKTIMRLTAANERAVKNWYEGSNAPSGVFLVVLCRHSPEVLETVLTLAGRHELVKTSRISNAKAKLQRIALLIDEL